MEIVASPFRGASRQIVLPEDVPFPSTDAARPLDLIRRCPKAGKTPLTGLPNLAKSLRLAEILVKDERDRMGLGSFKALGAAYVIAQDAQEGRARGTTYVTASAGNHGLSVAAGAQAFKANAVVYIAETVPETFAGRLRDLGAKVVREGRSYEFSMAAAQQAARDNGWTLLSDSSWPGYVDPPYLVMEGYLVLMAEVFGQIAEPPTHVFLQAGVGGLAAASAALARDRWGDDPIIVVVEPEFALALTESIRAESPIVSRGPVSAMGRLDCKEPSLIALKGLARDADLFATISEEEGEKGAAVARQVGLHSTPSGAAGLAALLAAEPHRAELGLTGDSRVLIILSEGAER
ncbi:pyridoxal-phosphate dependent enzyme [Sedimentitalea sp. JM2-8]|uniref:Pyridoxal-phosphate dependent enzyme n=1 Tax=Sedimentitalea xiamensis TaxID=3050037 RepID=A0ABT7FBW7_9RHOB|nr:pyridoxal-phosphate dependent enzyme [Sedimentitalea xiamensis]MDK3072610.1 pyridoxal-phosphate dependent enzyme [Sedimentitalea xiamensis]